jgi:hypothetical protein
MLVPYLLLLVVALVLALNALGSAIFGKGLTVSVNQIARPLVARRSVVAAQG